LSNLKKTIEQQKKHMEELKAQLADKDKTLAELDKKLKQVGWFVDAATLATTTFGLMTLGTENS
jgi:flagellar biosynthesis chaperone FliJ